MKLWIDDVRPAPKGYIWCKSVHEVKIHIIQHLDPDRKIRIEEINLDPDAGDYGEDYIEILEWLEQKEYGGASWNPCNIIFKTHGMNPVSVQNMRAIIRRNGWRES